MAGKLLRLVALLAVCGCESERTIPTRTKPSGETIACVGVAGKHKRSGIDYDVSTQNVIVAIVGIESIAPPVLVLLDETSCPVADTTLAPAPRSSSPGSETTP